MDQIIISDSELAPFISQNDPASKARGLLLQQRGVWELLRTGYDSLRSVKTRVFEFDGFHIKVQFNPGRMTSTAAKVDPHSIRERKCFLCTENLPPAQRGIPCDGEYLVLCNPFPIFPEHFTIASLHHTPQVIRDSFGAFLHLTQDLGARYTVFYNGPKCGASAPDHLHFQAGNRSFLPIDAEFATAKARSASRLFESDSLRVCSIEKCLRHVIAFESGDAGVLQRAFDALYGVLQDGATEAREPMLNVLGFYTNGEWRVLVFPRAKHRPSFYFKEGDEKLLISPAAVELGGICTTPREQDFEKVTRKHILQLYNEVCVAPEKFASITARLGPKLAALA
jgi:ATP adenylyltransferase/5',5'''-P-1,P-4-tetraphosphate phosphorylase II